MSGSYSDDETLELQEEEQPNRSWGTNVTSLSSERIRRSCASTDIAALMDTEMDEDSGRDEVEEHDEALPQRWIEYYRDKFNANLNTRWTPPALLEDRFRELLDRAVQMCENGHADGTVEQFISENLMNLFRKWYYSGDAIEHWPIELFADIGECLFKVLRMLRGLIVAGAGSRDICSNLWELFAHVAGEYSSRCNALVGERLFAMHLEVDESAAFDLIKPEHLMNQNAFYKYVRAIILLYGIEGYEATERFFRDNITTSTSIEDFIKYLKSFKIMVLMMKDDKAYATFGPIVFAAMERLTSASEEEQSCKNLRGPLELHTLYALYMSCHFYVANVAEMLRSTDNLLTLFHWRLKFLLKALNEAPFNGRMGAVESMTNMIKEFGNWTHARDYKDKLMEWLEEERAVDMLTRDNLHNASYVDRVQKTFEKMLLARMFTGADLSTVWEAQRGKHDVIQRNLAELIIRIVPYFSQENDLIPILFHKIQAGWVDGGVRERDMLIDIVRRIGENAAFNMNKQQPLDCDQALIYHALQTLWTFIRIPGPNRDNEETASQAHLKLLDESRFMQSYVKEYAEHCSADIQTEGKMAATAASHLVHILELASDDDDDEEELDYASNGRYDLIGSLESSHSLVQSLCANIAKTVRSNEDVDGSRKAALSSFLNALGFVLQRNKEQLNLSEKQASDLWEALISNPVNGNDPKLGFKFFVDVVNDDVMDKPMLERFFDDYVLAVPAASVTSDGYLCFEAFFKAVNEMEGKAHDFFKNPDNLLGAHYMRELMLLAPTDVYERASNLWVEYLQKMIYKDRQPAMTANLVQSLVRLIMEQYASMGEAVRGANARHMQLSVIPAYKTTKERTMRCIKVLSLLVNTMDEEVMVARRSEPSLGKAAIGRPIYVNCKVPRREWETVNYKCRGTIRAEDLDAALDLHENTTVADMREAIRKQLSEKLSRRRSESLDDVVDHFLLVFNAHDGPKKLLFTDYKRTLGEMGMEHVAEVEVRLHRTTSPTRQQGGGEASDSTSTSECDWLSPEELIDDAEKEAILPSRALAADAALIDRLLEVAECADMEIAMHAFRLLTMVPQNEQKLRELHASMRDEQGLRNLLENASDSRFLYYLMMLEAFILPPQHALPGDPQCDHYASANNALMMFIRVLPHVAKLNKLMQRSVAFRSLAIMPITHILQLACMTATRVVAQCRFRYDQQMASMVNSLLRLTTVDLPIKWTKHIRVRRLSSMYCDNLDEARGAELVELVERHASLQLRFLCGVVLSAAAFQSCSPLAAESERALATLFDAPLPLLDEATMDSDPCTVPALLECAVYALALLAAACPQQCAEFIGAVSAEPDPVWVHTVVAAAFHKAECGNVRVMSWSLAVGMVEVVRASLRAMQHERNWLDPDTSQSAVGLTEAVLVLLPACKGTDRFADQFVLLVKECLTRSNSWDAQLVRLDEHIQEGVEFLETALLQSNAEQTSFPDETYLRARIEVLRILMRYTTNEERAALGSRADGPRLCERLLADFIFPAARVAAAAGDAASTSETASNELDQLPRSSTHMEMNSSSSLFELTRGSGNDASIPRSLSALPLASARRVPVCSGEGSQEGAFNLLLALCEGVPENQILAQQTIHRLFYSNPWTDKKDFDYLPQHILRGEGDLVGLKNGGATCYMNSIFQQLFMIDEVREAVLNATIPEKVLLERRTSDSSSSSVLQADAAASATGAPNRGDYAVKVLAAVQTLFAHLLGSELESYRPAEFWKVFAFKPNGESVNVREQQDAVEFHNMVTELIDEGLKKCGGEAACERTFRGVFADEKICKDCPHRFTKEEPFESLSLDVRSHNNLRDSLKEYVKGDVLENDNAYHCEMCNKKVKAIKRMSLSKLPEVLIVQLKRFDFDWEKEISVKFNDYFEFPFEMDIQPYTVEGLEKLEKGLALENNRDYQYMLRGVVVHSGQAQGGHYTSYIRNRETGKWFKFDDNDVSLWDATENGAQQRWFGCTDSGLDSMGRGRRKMRTTYWNAYMLFYEKLETANRYLSVNPSSVASDMSTSSGVSSMTTTMTTIMSSAVSSNAISCPSSVSPTTASYTTGGATAVVTTGAAVSPSMLREQQKEKEGGGESMKTPRCSGGKSASPVSNLHRHFSSMSLSSARIRMPPRLEEMLREGNRRVQLERVQYSTHYFAFITAATSKAITTAKLIPSCEDRLLLETMKSFASFIVHNALFASRDLLTDDGKCSFPSWVNFMAQLLQSAPARLWFITHVLFSHEIAACFLFASDASVREFFRRIIIDTMMRVDESSDASEACLEKEVSSPLALQLALAVRQFPRLSHLLANLLGMLPYKHNGAFRAEPIDFYRTICDLADKHMMLGALVRGGILNNLLALFSPSHAHLHTTELSSLQRRDSQVYESLLRVVAAGLRTIRLETAGEWNPYSDKDVIVRKTEIIDLKVLVEFLYKDGGHVKFIHHLVDLLRRANRANSSELRWATWGVLWICHVQPTASAVVIDAVCTNMGVMVSDTAMEWLLQLLNGLFAIDDETAETRFEHLFFKAQLTSTHAQPSVQGLVEYSHVPESRYESLIRVLLSALIHFPRATLDMMLARNERVQRLLASMATFAMCRPGSRACQQLQEWHEDRLAAIAAAAETKAMEETIAIKKEEMEEEQSVTEVTSSTSAGGEGEEGGGAETMEEDDVEEPRGEKSTSTTSTSCAFTTTSTSDRPSAANNSSIDYIINSSNYSPGQLSPSSRLGAMSLGEKRPRPDEEVDESDECGGPSMADRKRSIGETARGDRVQWSTASTTTTATSPTTTATMIAASGGGARIEDRAASPMDDRDLLISSSTPSTSGTGYGVPSAPPPAYSPPAYQAVAGGGGGSRMAPPPVPPRPAARHIDTTSKSTDSDEFVEKHKRE